MKTNRTIRTLTWFFALTAALGFYLMFSLMVSEGIGAWELPETQALYTCPICNAMISPFDGDNSCDQCGFPHE